MGEWFTGIIDTIKGFFSTPGVMGTFSELFLLCLMAVLFYFVAIRPNKVPKKAVAAFKKKPCVQQWGKKVSSGIFAYIQENSARSFEAHIGASAKEVLFGENLQLHYLESICETVPSKGREVYFAFSYADEGLPDLSKMRDMTALGYAVAQIAQETLKENNVTIKLRLIPALLDNSAARSWKFVQIAYKGVPTAKW